MSLKEEVLSVYIIVLTSTFYLKFFDIRFDSSITNSYFNKKKIEQINLKDLQEGSSIRNKLKK